MKRYGTAAVLTLLILVAGSGVAVAQMGQGKRAGQQMPAWDRSTVQTIKGTVATEKAMGQADLMLLTVKTDTGLEVVVLGPKQFLDPGLASLTPDSPVEVTGSRVKGPNREFILAGRVKAADREYMVRNDEGQFVDKDGQPLKRGAAK
ncbi:MAG TPA: hypothetical protein VGT40_18925 [Methylomirabilota bacterium]|jgi:hypothetical protein|nr:hypothetical protein [Methylomirabilota bacterium]